jgi:hypothetical protein
VAKSITGTASGKSEPEKGKGLNFEAFSRQILGFYELYQFSRNANCACRASYAAEGCPAEQVVPADGSHN